MTKLSKKFIPADGITKTEVITPDIKTQKTYLFFIKEPVHDIMHKMDMTDSGKKLFGQTYCITTDESFNDLVLKVTGSDEIGFIIDQDTNESWFNDKYNAYSDGYRAMFKLNNELQNGDKVNDTRRTIR